MVTGAVCSLPPRECGVASGNCLQGRVLQRLRVGVLAGLHEVVQVEVDRDEGGGLAVRLVQGQGRPPLDGVGPTKRLHLLTGFCAATSPAACSTPRVVLRCVARRSQPPAPGTAYSHSRPR